jgi:Zn-dependent peptidase ImmA (M78 family)
MSQRSEVCLSPVEYAKKLLLELNIKDVPIYPRKIAKELGIFVRERKADSGYDGYLLSANGTWGMMINSSIRSKARKRFTVAHELGHYCIDYHNGTSYQCFGKDIGVTNSSARQDEREANEFAVELLMPDGLFREDIRQRHIGLGTINSLATKYGTSMTSTAIRYARSNPNACAIVVSEQSKIKYFAYSEGFRERKCLYLSRNAPLRDGSYAKRLFDAGLQIPEGQGEVTASSWSTNATDPKVTVLEHSKCLPTFNQVLSLIWFHQKEDNKHNRQIAYVLVE